MPSLQQNSERDDGDTPTDRSKDETAAWLSYTVYAACEDAVTGSAAASSREVKPAQKSKKNSQKN